ncbi:glycine--tRNA ligase [candidate division WWE3 bacterium]|uniref:Glycine--tRNA ligase n=1 Tax=candidate division WWE3 bacterium TaxID=2053526 RepID=A0A955LL15_UNCKA|nr:glycine--tRNA ligase [candidate division WWE3 bacterium]
MAENMLETITSLSKRRGFVYQNSEIYGGMSALYDYGPLGAELRNNLHDLWWKKMVHQRADVYGIDGRNILHPKVWEASGHIKGFADALVEDKVTHERFAADKLVEDQLGVSVKSNDIETINTYIKEGKLKSPHGNPITEAKNINQLMAAEIGTVEGDKMKVYLKGESCQNIYVNYKQVLDSMHPKIPFGIAQIGRAFRNEITLGQFLFRQREFDQADVQYFVHPSEASRYYEEWKEIRWNYYINELGINEERLRWQQHSEDERAFYARDAWDIQYNFEGMGFKEIEGLHDRSNYDLTQHQKFSGVDLSYTNPQTKESFIPFIVECSGGFDRSFLAVLFDAYYEDEVNDRIVLKLKPTLAPYKAAVFPLVKNKEDIVTKAKEIFNKLSDDYSVAWDDRGNIGKRYYSQDEIGTPWCITVDYETLEEGSVTVRDRDTMEQIRVSVKEIGEFVQDKLR